MTEGMFFVVLIATILIAFLIAAYADEKAKNRRLAEKILLAKTYEEVREIVRKELEL